MIINARQNQTNTPGATPDDFCRVKNNLKALFLTTITLTLLSIQVRANAAEESIYDEISTTKSGTVNRELVDFKAERENNINGVKYEVIEVRDELNQLIANPDKVETVTTEKTVVKKINPPPIEKTIVATPKTLTAKPKKNITEKLIVSKSLKIIPKEVKILATKAIATVKRTPEIYTKHDTGGNLVNQETEQWSCVHDTNNGLMWEVKSNDDSMRNSNNLYSWFKSDEQTSNGVSDGGRCNGNSACDTNSYIQAMNKQNYCGHNDWKLPTQEQMQTLVYLKNNDEPVKINKKYFPETVASWYWTASENNSNNNFAWYILFRNGVALSDLKERPKHIRLVRKTHSNNLAAVTTNTHGL